MVLIRKKSVIGIGSKYKKCKIVLHFFFFLKNYIKFNKNMIKYIMNKNARM